MEDRIENREGRFSIRRFILKTRQETPQERADAEDSLYRQMMKETPGSDRHDMIFGAYRAFRRLPERTRAVIFNREIPIWFNPLIEAD